MSKRITIITLFVLVGFIFAGCSGSGSPESVAKKFWEASKKGNKAAAEKYVTKESIKNLTDESGSKNPNAKVTFGKTEMDGAVASIPTEIKDGEMTLDLKTVCVKEDGKWKVDLDKTMMSMFGGAMGEMMKELTDQMGNAMKSGMEGMGDALKKGVGDAAEGMGKAMGELGKTLKDTSEKLKGSTEKSTDVAKAGAKSFKVDDPVVVEWHGRWWPAKVLEVGNNKWKIHYDGYSASWDEWVGPERINSKK